MLEQIEAEFASLPSGERPELFIRPEPEQQGERRVTVERPGLTAFLSIAHRVPESTHDDWFSLEVVDSVLTGAGSGIDNKTSRLYKALMKTGIVAGIDGGMSESIDPYLYEITATLNDGYTHGEAETIILAEIERIQRDGITQKELDKAKKQAKAAFAYSTESVTNQAFWLAQSAMLGDLQWYDSFLKRLNAVTLDDVQVVACKYLVPPSPDNRLTCSNRC